MSRNSLLRGLVRALLALVPFPLEPALLALAFLARTLPGGGGLVLLGLALLLERLVVRESPGDLLGLALQVLGEALFGGLRSGLGHSGASFLYLWGSVTSIAAGAGGVLLSGYP